MSASREHKEPVIDLEKEMLILQRLQLMDTALSGEPYVEAKGLTESEAEEHKAACENIKKYFLVKPQKNSNEETKEVSANVSPSRKNFSNPQSEAFLKFIESLNKFLDVAKEIEVVKKNGKNEVDKKIILGAAFNSVDVVGQCIKDITQLNINNHEKQEVNQALDDALKPLKANKFIKDKIKKLMSGSEESQKKCMNFLKNVEKSAEAFAHLHECLRILNESAFYNVNGRSVGFWSGTDGQKKANEEKDLVTDSNVPAVSIISYLGGILRKMGDRELSDKVFLFISAEFAKQAKGTIPIFTSV